MAEQVRNVYVHFHWNQAALSALVDYCRIDNEIVNIGRKRKKETYTGEVGAARDIDGGEL